MGKELKNNAIGFTGSFFPLLIIFILGMRDVTTPGFRGGYSGDKGGTVLIEIFITSLILSILIPLILSFIDYKSYVKGAIYGSIAFWVLIILLFLIIMSVLWQV